MVCPSEFQLVINNAKHLQFRETEDTKLKMSGTVTNRVMVVTPRRTTLRQT